MLPGPLRHILDTLQARSTNAVGYRHSLLLVLCKSRNACVSTRPRSTSRCQRPSCRLLANNVPTHRAH
ncbi:hypothetical protein J6590_065344 [Homalodisca vitripennis]|nr:hypothetical protein J6590_065344 [Homalodisca vitripennis]